MREKVKEFLTDPYIQNLIQNNQWDKIYSEEVYNYNMYEKDIGEFTYIMISSGVDPLNYLERIPDYYLSTNMPMKEFTIPEGIEIIGLGAFVENKIIQKINLPKSLKFIDRHAFYGCSNLSRINYNGILQDWEKVKEEDEQTFYGIKAKSLYCIDGYYPINNGEW